MIHKCQRNPRLVLVVCALQEGTPILEIQVASGIGNLEEGMRGCGGRLGLIRKVEVVILTS